LSFGAFPTFSDSSVNPNTVVPVATQPDQFDTGYSPLLAFSQVQVGSGAVEFRTIDGNLPENRRLLFVPYHPLVWQTNQFLVIRWFADTTYGKDLALAIDDLRFQAARFAFSRLERSSTGSVQLTLAGLPGDVYQVDGSTDLITWSTVGSVTN